MDCDAVILAASPRPLRNIDGAMLDPSEGVTFVQPLTELPTPAHTAEEARAAAVSLAIESLSGGERMKVRFAGWGVPVRARPLKIVGKRVVL